MKKAYAPLENSDKKPAMLDKNDTSYYNVQGTMIIDPAINSDVALVESKKAALIK